ncbi:sigma-70 family RNA polymerase sigma factor [Luteolibacter flavescens]|uniref:Sigma-70 family RNA polymerase sigma factor n=1 Tax=Luteolibacter flavescens TaxID=1859460 RepID=A0ABT3FSW0_9BACT|nr:sigma-70 family RNA polymerase sigma factor [Luteolibacter flavescens]MCW1886326.1 sigma-70 family RNA polymerase sigma factor [Luteolibacter flavescens]
MIHEVTIPEAGCSRVDLSVTDPDFEELLKAQQHRLLLHIKSMVRNHHEAEDLLQRTNIVLWRKRKDFQRGTNFGAWCASIARLETLNQLKQRRRDERVFSYHAPDEPRAAAFSEVPEEVDEDTLAALRSCLGRLPLRDRELLLVRYGSEKTLQEYAASLNRQPGTLKARLFKIRETLRKSIEDELMKAGRKSATGWGRDGV